MLTVLTSPKPGSGTSTTAALLALALRRATWVHVVDLCGDQTALFGIPGGSGTTHVAENLTLHDLSCQSEPDQRRAILRLARLDAHVVVDAGTERHELLDQLPTDALHYWVLRPCYLALRRAATSATRPDGVILLDELGRALTAADAEAALGAPVVATIEVHPQIARAIDAGLLIARPPQATLEHLALLTTPTSAVQR